MPEAIVVGVLGPGRLGETHVAALARLRDQGLRRKHEEVPSFQIDGENGSLYFTLQRLWAQPQADTPLFRYDARKPQSETLADWQSVDIEPRDPFEVQLDLFLRGVMSGQPTPGLPTWEDAVTNQTLIQAAYLSVAERREVSPEEIAVVHA